MGNSKEMRVTETEWPVLGVGEFVWEESKDFRSEENESTLTRAVM